MTKLPMGWPDWEVDRPTLLRPLTVDTGSVYTTPIDPREMGPETFRVVIIPYGDTGPPGSGEYYRFGYLSHAENFLDYLRRGTLKWGEVYNGRTPKTTKIRVTNSTWKYKGYAVVVKEKGASVNEFGPVVP